MNIIAEQLARMLPYATDRKITKFLTPINITLNEFDINNPYRVAGFIGQIGVESGSLKYVEEIADGSNYEYRKDLGNLKEEALTAAHAAHTTSGKFYKGRGLIQVTGYYNYKKCGEALHFDLVADPIALTDPLLAARSAGWFWKTHGCNELADRKEFRKITRVINGAENGPNTHLVDRLAITNRCLTILGNI